MRSSLPSSITWAVGMLVVVSSMTGTVHATAAIVPEISGTSIATGLGLLSGAVLILRARMHR